MPCATKDGQFTHAGGDSGLLGSDTRKDAVQFGIRAEYIDITDKGAGHCDDIVQGNENLGADFFHTSISACLDFSLCAGRAQCLTSKARQTS